MPRARPTWLELAHRQIDGAVLDAHGWPHDLDDEAIPARLLARVRPVSCSIGRPPCCQEWVGEPPREAAVRAVGKCWEIVV
jgi:hypothetical protein